MIARPAFATIAFAVVLAGCASAPPREVASAPEPLICPPVATPVCPAPAAPIPPVPAPPVEYRGKLQAASWADLPAWGRDSLRPSLPAFLQSCQVLDKQDAWKGVCAGAQTLANASERDVATFFELNFEPHQVMNADDSSSGMVTGYYEPLLRGSRVRTDKFRHPIYGVPADLLTIDLSSVYPELKHRRLRGRIEGSRVVPYAARADIDRNGGAARGNEIVWVDDAIEVYKISSAVSSSIEVV